MPIDGLSFVGWMWTNQSWKETIPSSITVSTVSGFLKRGKKAQLDECVDGQVERFLARRYYSSGLTGWRQDEGKKLSRLSWSVVWPHNENLTKFGVFLRGRWH